MNDDDTVELYKGLDRWADSDISDTPSNFSKKATERVWSYTKAYQNNNRDMNVKVCECGSEKTYGENDFHSDWCALYIKK